MKIAILCALLSALPSSLALSQTSSPVYVFFSFRVASATNNIPIPVLPIVESDISQRLARQCTNAFPFWSMLAGSSTQHPALNIWLTEDQSSPDAPWFINVELVIPKLRNRSPWLATFFPPGEFRRLAGTLDTNRWATLIEQRFQDNLLIEVNKSSIQERLQTFVPLGYLDPTALTNSFSGSPQLLVLPLNWNQCAWFSGSEFVIPCRSANGPVRLHLIGTEHTAKFTPTTPLFDGLAARLQTWEFAGNMSDFTNHLHEVTNLQPCCVHLKKPIESSLGWTIAGPH